MKPKFTKSISYPLIFSAVLHGVLFFVFTVLYNPEPNLVNNITHLEIQHIPTERALRTIKRQRYIPPKYIPVRHNQLEVTVNPTITALPAAIPLAHQNPVIPIRGFSLPAPHTLEHKQAAINATTLNVVPGIGRYAKIGRIQSHKIFRGTKQQSFVATVDAALPVVNDLPLPTVVLERIGRHIVAHRGTDTVDVVFIIDASGSMKDNINAIRNHLHRMTEQFQTAGIDYTLGVVIFRDHATYNIFGWDFEVTPQTRSVLEIKRILAKVRCTGGEKALDALVRATDEVEYRRNADVHFLLITDEYVSGNYSARDVLTKMRDANIKVDVIGLDEPFQKCITRRTGGLWFPISSLDVY